MKKSIRNFVIGAAMAITTLAASTAAFAGQFVQNDMNFRSGASAASTLIGCVPAGAQVDVIKSENGWDLVNYNGTVGYIHGGNLADSYTPQQQTYSTTQSYFDNNWTQTAQNMNATSNGAWKTVNVTSGYLAFRTTPAYDSSNEIGQLHTGDQVQLIGGTEGSYVRVYSPKFGTHGWVNAGFLA